MIVCSMDEAYLKRKAREILVVLRRAKRENRRVVWS